MNDGIANPGVAIVPIATAAQLFRQAAGGSRDNGPCGFVGQEFQDQGRAMHHLAPTAAIRTLRQPVTPIIDRLFEQCFGLGLAEQRIATARGGIWRSTKAAVSPSCRTNSADYAMPSCFKGTRVASSRLRLGGVEAGPARKGGGLMRVACVIEGGATVQPKSHGAADDVDPANQPVMTRGVSDGTPTGMKSVIWPTPSGDRKRVTRTLVSGQ